MSRSSLQVLLIFSLFDCHASEVVDAGTIIARVSRELSRYADAIVRHVYRLRGQPPPPLPSMPPADVAQAAASCAACQMPYTPFRDTPRRFLRHAAGRGTMFSCRLILLSFQREA